LSSYNIMAPQPEGGPSGEGRNYSGQSYADDGRRYQSDRDLSEQPLPRPNGAFASENRIASPAGSGNGRERTSGERNRSRNRSGRTASGQLRICKKCGEPLTGQFVRALGGTFHLDCFRCRVSTNTFNVLFTLLTFVHRIAGRL
jgi:hypothetical protein